MIQNIDYKVPNGKLLRLQADLDKDVINSIKISGDFFIHPETAIIEIERLLAGLKIQDIPDKLDKFIKEKEIILLGFNPADLVDALIDNTKFKVAIAQMDMISADKDKNLEKASALISKAKKNDADLICFPEYFSTGCILERFNELAEAVPGNTTGILSEIAQKNKIGIIGSIIEKDGDKLYNTAIFIDHNGTLAGKNRKIHLFLKENDFVKKGKEHNVFNTHHDKIGTMVCYDTIFPEVARKLALKGVKIIFIPANWPNPFLSQWKLSTSARALDNQIWIVAVNRVGKDNTFTYFGTSRIIDPFGEVAVECGDSEELLVFEIDLKRSNEFKQTINFLNDIRID